MSSAESIPHHPLINTALLLIDIQEGLNHPTYWGLNRSNPAFESNIVKLLDAFRAAQPESPNIFHVCHHSVLPSSPLHPSTPGVNFMSCAMPKGNEPVYSKTVNNPFVETCLAEDLEKKGIKTLYICGLTTNHCVDTTVRMASNQHVVGNYEGNRDGGRLVLIGDATAAFDGKGVFDADTIMNVHVESLKGEFCEVLGTNEVVDCLERLAKEI
ncbi:Isochorismatase-like hydrolase [Glarea lozoyensis ATCC 20868]|uniref:Isochorismatase-like hydrolase n=1 Tax=Glarea lozoyensis (strain ATCC 20868 / MF5171) TaxID=1116229 RepID=S3DZU0_GLAL2|nr:Isochorismatase-like hydrolase [Glarea lozoyensis ATCC 20868]EPE31808.1 Isochorismatase-like hydrolase [Glarea lozoyensis ATCC 20868]